MTTEDSTRKAEALRALHHGPDCLVLANAWDPMSARIVEQAGHRAIATSSAGVAWAQGYADGDRIPRDEMIAAVGRIVAAVEAPVTADLENGYGEAESDVAKTVEGLLAAGGVGLNLEDSAGREGHRVYAREQAVARIRAARGAADAAGVPVVINARTDVFFPTNKHFDDRLAEAVARGNAFLEAGADCVFVPFVAKPEIIAALVERIDGPLNVLGGSAAPTIPELAELGVRRVSIGGGFSRMIYGAVRKALAEIDGPGTYGWLDGEIPHPELNSLMDG